MARGVPLTPAQIQALGKSYEKSRSVAHAARVVGVSYAAAWKAIHGRKNDRRRYLHERALEKGLRQGRRDLARNAEQIADLLDAEMRAGSIEPSHIASLQSAHSSAVRELVRLSLLEIRRVQLNLSRGESRLKRELTALQARHEALRMKLTEREVQKGTGEGTRRVTTPDDPRWQELQREVFGTARQGFGDGRERDPARVAEGDLPPLSAQVDPRR
jgi:molybdenum-dependent DNA-binding transcriptional regulator ModE